MQQTELNLTKKHTKNHSFVPATALRALLDGNHYTRGTFCTLAGVHNSTISNWLSTYSMPKGISLLCEKLLAEATAPQVAAVTHHLVSVPSETLPTFQALISALKLTSHQLPS